MHINGRELTAARPPYIVAEIGAGHSGSLELALDLVRDAYRANADAVKLQTYTPDSMTLPIRSPQFQIMEGGWKGRNLYDLYQEAHTPREWHKPLFDEGKRLGMTVFSSPFSPEDVEFLESLGCPAYKVASCEIGHMELLEAIRQTKKPVIVSTGMASRFEISRAVEALYGRKVTVLHCVSGYPTPLNEANIWRVRALKSWFPRLQVGYSDHTRSAEAAALAVACGATIIEKHIGERTSLDGDFATNPLFFSGFVTAVRDAWAAMQEREALSEATVRTLRRSVYAARPIEAGQIVSRQDLAVVRPDGGMDPADIEEIVGRKAITSINIGAPIALEMFR